LLFIEKCLERIFYCNLKVSKMVLRREYYYRLYFKHPINIKYYRGLGSCIWKAPFYCTAEREIPEETAGK